MLHFPESTVYLRYNITMLSTALFDTGFLRSIQAAAEEQARLAERMREPMLRIAQAYEPIFKNMNALSEALRPSLIAMEGLHRSLGIYPVTTAEESTEVAIVPKPVLVEKIAALPVNTDIAYDAREKTLSRTVNGAYRVYAFEDKTRGRLFAWLLTARKYVATEELRMEFGRNNTDAIRKIVQGVNDEAKTKLGLKERIIIGKRGSGYRINPSLFVHRT
jgi:hypothetical protein